MPSNLDRIKQLKKQQEQATAEVSAETVSIHALCGHKAKPDATKDSLGGNCPACAKATKERKAKAAKAKLHAKRMATNRLPDGAVFNVTYSAASQAWTGTLKIPDIDVFQSTQSGVFPLLSRLDFLYRAWLQRQESGPANNTP